MSGAVEAWQLKQRQSLSLEQKIILSKERIREFYNHYNGQVYVAFSGGKDSTVLLHLVRSIYPDVPGVFVDTGLEYPEIRDFIKCTENIIWLKPKMTFKQVIEKYGYPVISKETAMAINRYRNTKREDQKQYRLHGRIINGKKQTRGTIPIKWHFLIDAPFKISEKCCEVMKKSPAKEYFKASKKVPFVGIMASDSHNRTMDYQSRGCNVYEAKIPQSRPLSFWLRLDIDNYIAKNELPYSKIYDMGEKHTGCVFCMFGCQFEKNPNRFQRMAIHHPNLYNYCMDKLELKKILEFVGVEA